MRGRDIREFYFARSSQKKEEDRGPWGRRDRGGKEKRKEGDDGCPIVDGRR